ncbi:DUF2865 domain-containing protein [Methylocystis parvus]|uniref:DUF2865 domain-containing protein n=1 Tax=Methylocystis parvus TaxID=134 RepID=A0A6B8M8D6_9HYPH|nr:DUF2865 domain-containing protein [Methylocystis parvus]QGM99031.1 DUF2865 domain-containing protein [Methylocystis parvus]WBK00603.1 DUF2865 domain-containing protein [Methylocystis parvus OBBP]
MRPTLGPMNFRGRFAVAFATALLVLACAPRQARAESGYCTDLRAQIAKAGAEGMQARYRAAAAKQRAEYGRLAAKAHAMGCDQQQFLFFGDPPPPQCGSVNARLNALEGTIAAYDQGASDDSQRQALMARYEVDCRQRASAREPQPKSFFEELFGVGAPDRTTGLREVPVGAPDPTLDPNYQDEGEPVDQRPSGGPMAICVRSCDGGFFPITYSAKASQLDDLNAFCKAMCPGAEAKLYTQSQWKGLDSAVSIDGEPYADHPNARKFEKSYEPSCGCKPQGQSWTEALAEAERMLAERNKKDQMITAEQAEQMSRPIQSGDPRARRPEGAAAVAAPLVGDGLRGTQGSVTTGAPEVFREVVGPDGVKRRVRVVAPTL